jgi:tetratricopeptide (TPR) repeat protein
MRYAAWVVVPVIAGSLAIGSALAHAQGPVPVGTKVVTKYETPLRIGERVVDDGAVFRIYTVRHVSAEWLWLVADSVTGWVQSSEVVPIDEAVDFYTQEIRANRGAARAYVRRGTIRRAQGETDKALADYTQAIRLEPNYAAAFVGLGLVWYDKQEYDKAIADYTEAVRLDPSDASAFWSRGHAWQDKTDYDKALADYNEAIRLEPKWAKAYYSRAFIWLNKNDYDKALADYTETIRLDPRLAAALNMRGNLWWVKKAYDKALADYTEAIRLDPKLAAAFASRAGVWLDKKDYAKALADYGEVVRLDPKDAAALESRAWLWATCPVAKLRDGKKAVESATRACELLEWKYASTLETLAAAYAEVGDFEKAVGYEEKALRLEADPSAKQQFRNRLALYKNKQPYREGPDQ